MRDFVIWVSGIPVGFLICFYWLAKPMARLLGLEDDRG